MIIIAPVVHNWKTLNIFSPVEERGDRNALRKIKSEPKCFVYVSLKIFIIINKLQGRIIFHMKLMKEPKLSES